MRRNGWVHWCECGGHGEWRNGAAESVEIVDYH
jgi:hypothetical protein